MSSFEETFRALLARYVTKYADATTTVLSYEQDEEASGYCETCYYEETVVRVKYISSATGERREYTYYGDMGELIRELARLDEEAE